MAGGVGAGAIQEINYYQNGSVVAKTGKWKTRRIHTLKIETAEHLGKISWVRGEKAVRASIVLQQRAAGRLSKDLKEIIVVVPAGWKFLSRVEKLRDETDTEVLCEFISHWQYWELLVHSGLEFGGDDVKVDSKVYYPAVRSLRTMADESLRLVAAALERLTVNQSAQSWARHLKSPDLFKPENREAELKQWSEWKFAFLNYVKGIDPTMANDMDVVEKNMDGDYTFDDMLDETKGRAVRLFSLLTSYLRLRPLKLIRHVNKENGFEAWQILLKEMQPATRARSLALLSQLSRVQFADGKTISEQLPQFESIVNEYERISNQKYSDDAKVAAILLACPAQIRQHLHLWLTETTTYEQLKERIIQLEAVTTKWDSNNSLMLPTRASNDEATPMEVDYVGKSYNKGKKGGKDKGKDGKGKAKGKEKGKNKDARGFWKGNEKGKTQWEKGPGKKGKNYDKGSKGGKTGLCHSCGKPGHFAKDCWKRVNQIEEQVNPGGASSSSTGMTGQTSTIPTTASVKMVRLETPPEARSMEIFDLTTPRDSGDASSSYPWRVGMIQVEDHEVGEFFDPDESEYMDCHEPVVKAPAGVAIIAMDLQDERPDYMVNMVKIENVEDDKSCLVTLDSGADISVLPKSYANVGSWRPKPEELRMVDAQGKSIEHDGITKARIRVVDKNGKVVELVEEFILGNVQHPILCAGRLLKRGWCLGGMDGVLSLKHEEKSVDIPLNTDRNSLQFEAQIYMVEVHVENPFEASTTARILALAGYLSKYVQGLELAPGWHRLPNGVAVYSDPVACHLLDPKGSIEKIYKARMTLVKNDDGTWTQVENVEDYNSMGNNAFRRISPPSNPLRTLSFFAPTKIKDYWEQGSEVPITPYPEIESSGMQRTDWSEDEGEEPEILEGQEMVHDVEKDVIVSKPNEIELDEVIYSDKTSVKDLQMACKERGLAHTGSKRRLLDRMLAFKVNLENQMQLSVASKLFQENQRRPISLGQPKLPSVEEQELHFVTHQPYAPWCQACIASRAKEDPYKSTENKEDIGKSVIQIDFCYTYTGDEDRLDRKTSDKVEERQDQFGTCLIATASDTKAIHAVPVPSKGTASLKTITEEIIRFTLENASRDSCVLQADSERATRQILRSVQQVRSMLGLTTEIRLTGAGQHASNGQVERGVQTIRRMANCLRAFAEDRASLNIWGNFHVFPWAFRHAAFLVNRFRVLEKCGKTSHELATGRPYKGKLALFGESVMFKRMVQYKGSNVFQRGVWVGKHPWNDSHIVLTSEGAFESRTIRRLPKEDSFIATDIVSVRGLPWSYSPQGILMRQTGQKQRSRQPTLEEEASEQELKEIANDVADGIVTPTPGVHAAPDTPGLLSTFAPMTPALPSSPKKPAVKRLLDEEIEGEERVSKKVDASTSPRKGHEKRVIEEDENVESEEKKSKMSGVALPSMATSEARTVESSPRGSPTAQLYPPICRCRSHRSAWR